MNSIIQYQNRTLPPLLQENLQKIGEILQRHKVVRAYAFGSVCTDRFRQESDIDLIIAFEKRFFEGYVDNFLSLENELSKLLQRKIDLLTEETLQNPYFIKVVNQTKTLIYE